VPNGDRLSFKTLDRQFQQEAIDGLSCSPLEAKALTEIVKEVFQRKKDPVQVARETDHSPEAVGKYCQQFNKAPTFPPRNKFRGIPFAVFRYSCL
jgi:hypothetical protein